MTLRGGHSLKLWKQQVASVFFSLLILQAVCWLGTEVTRSLADEKQSEANAGNPEKGNPEKKADSKKKAKDAPHIAASIAELEKLAPAERAFFEEKIRPVLVKQCYSCHSADAEEQGGNLRMDLREAMRAGGQSGPVLVAGKPEESLLIKALKYDGIEMPPDEPLPEAVIADFVKWVQMGAPDPRSEQEPAAKNQETAAAETDESLWAFQPPKKPELPAVTKTDWTFDPLDTFVLAKMEAAGQSPVADASPQVLIRRLYYDLIGLPPTMEQVQSFVSQHEQNPRETIEKLVDELLASPHFGERWGRHWLDIARYGESNGNDGLSRNPTFPHAWRYRDYVIAALNADTPYDRFLTEQIAGDLLPADSKEDRDRQLIATGFLAIGSKAAKAMNINFEMDVVADQIDVIGTSIMGLSVTCARCHDHKHDPIPTSDYYALAGIFTSTETLWGAAAYDPLTAPATTLHKLATATAIPPIPDDLQLDPGAKEEFERTKQKTKSANPQGAAFAMGVQDRAKPVDCKVNIKGESNQLGKLIPRGFLSACTPGESLKINAKQSGRLELAQWLTSGNHPLTARVMVNRVWQHLFGEGMVRTPDDFGVYGERPTHPELLDHLALEFQNNGWSLKKLIRSIVLSRTYRLSSDCSPELLASDPDNRLYCRHNRRRLDAESLRDSILAASGELDLQPGQGSAVQYLDILVNKAENLHRKSNHRSIYLCLLRNSDPPELAAFDFPDTTRPVGKRNLTTLPTQALFLLNSPFVIEQSQQFARKMSSLPDMDNEARVDWLYRRALLREPTTDERNQSLALVQNADSELAAQVPEQEARSIQSWSVLCQALFAASEFRYVD